MRKSLLAMLRPDPMPPEVETLMGTESRLAQVRTLRIRLGVGAIDSLSLFPNWGANAAITMWLTLALALSYMTYAALALRLSQRDSALAWLGAATVTVDTLVVAGQSATSLVNHAGAYEALLAPLFPVLTLLFLSLTALPYSVRVALWGALLASGTRLALLLWCVTTHQVGVSDVATSSWGTGCSPCSACRGSAVTLRRRPWPLLWRCSRRCGR